MWLGLPSLVWLQAHSKCSTKGRLGDCHSGTSISSAKLWVCVQVWVTRKVDTGFRKQEELL